MSSEQIIWLVGAACASVFLLKMMRDRQVAVTQLIRRSVEEKLRWMRKKAKAARMIQRAARQKADHEQEVQAMFADDQAAEPKPDDSAEFASELPSEETAA